MLGEVLSHCLPLTFNEVDCGKESFLQNFVFTCFPILIVKLECFYENNYICHEMAKINSDEQKNYALMHLKYLLGLAPGVLFHFPVLCPVSSVVLLSVVF